MSSVSRGSKDEALDDDSEEADSRYVGIAQEWGSLSSVVGRIRAEADLLRPAVLATSIDTGNQACLGRNLDILQAPCTRYGHLPFF